MEMAASKKLSLNGSSKLSAERTSKPLAEAEWTKGRQMSEPILKMVGLM